MAKYRVLVGMVYSDFSRPGRVAAKELEPGDVVEAPVWYGEEMVGLQNWKEVAEKEEPIVHKVVEPLEANDPDVPDFQKPSLGKKAVQAWLEETNPRKSLVMAVLEQEKGGLHRQTVLGALEDYLEQS